MEDCVEKLYFEIPSIARKEDAIIREYYDETYAHCMVVDYNIDVKKALREHPEFEEIICPIEDIF